VGDVVVKTGMWFVVEVTAVGISASSASVLAPKLGCVPEVHQNVEALGLDAVVVKVRAWPVMMPVAVIVVPAFINVVALSDVLALTLPVTLREASRMAVVVAFSSWNGAVGDVVAKTAI
jgi:hypothetical protein